MTETARLLIDCRCALGEGPFWHDGRQQIFWLDINNQVLFAADENGKARSEWRFNEIVSAAAIINDDELALATETGLKRYNLETGEISDVVDIERDVPANRANDSRVHPSGAYWIGTMVKDEGPKDGGVYHYRAGALTKIISNAAIPNATCFSPDGTIDRTIELPVSQVTCPAFGGKDFTKLFITTAAKGLSDEQAAKEEFAGSLFVIDLDIAGLPEARIKL